MTNTNTNSTTVETNVSKFYDLTHINEGYINRIRQVKPAKGKPFFACTLRSADLSIDVIVVGAKAVKAMELLKPHFDKGAVIKAKWVASDISLSDFIYEKDMGDHQKGDKGFMAKGRLLDIVNVSVNGNVFEELPVNDTREIGTFGFGYLNNIKSFFTGAMTCSIAALRGEYNQHLGVKPESTRFSCDVAEHLVGDVKHLQDFSEKDAAIIGRFKIAELKKSEFVYSKDMGNNKVGDKGAVFIGAFTEIKTVFVDGVRISLLSHSVASNAAEPAQQENMNQAAETQQAQAEQA